MGCDWGLWRSRQLHLLPKPGKEMENFPAPDVGHYHRDGLFHASIFNYSHCRIQRWISWDIMGAGGCLHHQFEELHWRREEGAVIGLHDQHIIRWPPPDHGVLLLWVHHVVMCGLYIHSSCVLQTIYFVFVEPCAG